MGQHYLFVYGTLKRGFWNNRLLSDSRFIGTGKTIDQYPMVCRGVPFLINHAGLGHRVLGEVYSVSDAVLKSTDRLEGHPDWYERKMINIEMDQSPVNVIHYTGSSSSCGAGGAGGIGKNIFACWAYLMDPSSDSSFRLYDATDFQEEYTRSRRKPQRFVDAGERH